MPHTVIYVGNGLEHHENGINNIRACAYLDGLIGAVDQKGANYSPVGFPMKECFTRRNRFWTLGL